MEVHRNNLNLAKYLTIILKSNFIFLLDHVMALKFYRNFRTQIQRCKFIKDLRYVFSYFLSTFTWRIPVTHTSNMFKLQNNGKYNQQIKIRMNKEQLFHLNPLLHTEQTRSWSTQLLYIVHKHFRLTQLSVSVLISFSQLTLSIVLVWHFFCI